MPAISGSTLAPTQARAGIARFGATRVGYYRPNVLVKVNGVDYATQVNLETLEIESELKQPDRIGFTARNGLTASDLVADANTVVVALGADQNGCRMFSGTITDVEQEQEQAQRTVECHVSGLGELSLLDAAFVNGDYANETIAAISRDVIAQVNTALGTSYTANAVQGNLPAIDAITFTNIRPSTALSRLTAYVPNSRCYFLDGDLHFVTEDTRVTMPEDLTDSNHHFWDLQIKRSRLQLRTRIIVEAERTSCPIGTPDNGSDSGSTATAPVDYLAVGAGGGGGADDGGGGGGGEVLTGVDALMAGAYPVVIATGGTAGTTPAGDGSAGGNTTVMGHVARGAQGGLTGFRAGGPAGDGVHLGGAGDGATAAGGGAGADEHGTAAGTLGPGFAGRGGRGVSSSLEGAPAKYGGGGGGGGLHGGTGGDGSAGGFGITGGNGGSDTGPADGNPGAANTGGGGGGGHANQNGSAGASGKVVLSYPTGSLSAAGGTITVVGGRTIHTFTTNDTFVISSVAVNTAPAVVTDLPLEDASHIHNGIGTVRIGSRVFEYLSTGGPVVANGANPPGSTVSSDAAAGATSLSLVSTAAFTATPGWAKVGDQYLRFTGIGGGALTGIPTSGFGALAVAVKTGTQVTWLGHINLSVAGTTFDPPLTAQLAVVQRVVVNDLTAQATQRIKEVLIEDASLSYAGAFARANAELTNFNGPIASITYTTRDPRTKVGRTITASLGAPTNLSGVFTIRSVRAYGFDQCAPSTAHQQTAFPLLSVEAAPTNFIDALDLLSVGDNAR